MQRKSFIKKSLAAFTALNVLPVLDVFAGITEIKSRGELSVKNITSLPVIDDALQGQFNQLIDWLIQNGWADFLKNKTGVDIRSKTLEEELVRKLEIPDDSGLEDFAGIRLVEIGQPSLSLLYHVLASSRVKPFNDASFYPTVAQLDLLEDYIYSLSPLSYTDIETNNRTFAVLAYEYRPGFKVPPFDPGHELAGKKFADFVYSRTGVARIGTQDLNYDTINRCFVNQPIEIGREKEIAVTPARYGLFLIEKVEIFDQDIRVMNQQREEKIKNKSRYFIKPVRKICKSADIAIQFCEYHLNEKLFQLSQYSVNGNPVFDFSNYNTSEIPFRRVQSSDDQGTLLSDHTNDRRMVTLARIGSSVLLSSMPALLVTEAYQKGNRVVFEVPKHWKKRNQSNRRYSAFKVTSKHSKDDNDVIITDFFLRRKRITSRFGTPKNAPLFINIKYEYENDRIKFLDHNTPTFETKIHDGKYKAQVYEDAICDGSISARIEFRKLKGLEDTKLDLFSKQITQNCLSAFSLVTAPDFFPLIDSNDIRAYYYSDDFHVDEKKLNVNDEHFLEGGTINLSGIRQRANPSIKNPFTGKPAFPGEHINDSSFDTVSAVVATRKKLSENNAKTTSMEKFRYNYRRDYQQTSFLPDTASGIFFPGWDATYAGNADNPYFSTSGLGSPFPEDMKLCAAANGMWPVASPDAGRTFQGSLDKFPILGRPNTSIPLLDVELGIHEKSPYVTENGHKVTYGWDGEQGPFLIFLNNRLFVNYTDINSADYISNLNNPSIGFNMSLLRKLDTREVINRLDCMRKCIRKIDKGKVASTNKWLIVADEIEDWSTNINSKGIPRLLCKANVQWGARANSNLNGKGYLMVFAEVKFSTAPNDYIQSDKRRALPCTSLTICQVSEEALAYCVIEQKNFLSTLNPEWKSHVFNKRW
jgi:hypothetical protein